LGGGNWGGVSVDPSLGLLLVNVMNIGQWGHRPKKISRAVCPHLRGIRAIECEKRFAVLKAGPGSFGIFAEPEIIL
jgi:hypothetical protein